MVNFKLQGVVILLICTAYLAQARQFIESDDGREARQVPSSFLEQSTAIGEGSSSFQSTNNLSASMSEGSMMESSESASMAESFGEQSPSMVA